MAWQILFWTSVALLAYTFAGYQLLIGLLARVRRVRPTEATLPAPARPAAIVAAYNEEERIAARIENLKAATVPVEVIVCSDGSTDGTASAARKAGARVFEFSERRGKAACLSEVIPRLDAEIIVLADCRQQFTPDTIPRLLSHFTDPEIGAVSGILRIGDPRTAAGAGVDLYWKMETVLRKAESDFDSCIGCTGAVYAIRRPLFQPLDADIILDDVVIPMRIALAGRRVIYDTTAEAFDPQPLDPRAETVRKARTLAGNIQMCARFPAWLLPWKNRLAWQLVSHKYLRLAGPLFLVGALAASGCLAAIPFYRACLWVQLFLYLFAFAGLLAPRLRLPLFSIPAGFLFLNFMTLRGFHRFFFGSRAGAWERAATQEPE
ncbi:MAG TPA: glycosyltransferase family 2 protein [Chthoniobacteraceae bacterium]|jgi:cellulose synthase/poly-beta-1,6-N-acetylglucosamine synthase-like glycosyltransferase|nr:glycosyltransferase family 2 protein [Chthoniobacteraceae bacterium]